MAFCNLVSWSSSHETWPISVYHLSVYDLLTHPWLPMSNDLYPHWRPFFVLACSRKSPLSRMCHLPSPTSLRNIPSPRLDSSVWKGKCPSLTLFIHHCSLILDRTSCVKSIPPRTAATALNRPSTMTWPYSMLIGWMIRKRWCLADNRRKYPAGREVSETICWPFPIWSWPFSS